MKKSIRTALGNAFDSKETIFRDRYIFHENYEPDTILHRDDELDEISNFFYSFWKGSRGFLNVHGSVGSGKTLITKKLAKEFIQRAEAQKERRVKVIFLNCSSYGTRSQVLRKIAKDISGDDNVGWGVGMYTDKMKESLENYKNVLIILDEVDKLVEKPGEREVFYNLSNEPKFSLISISNVTEWMKKYIDDARVFSRQSETYSVLFLPYSKEQIFDILKYRAERGLRKGTYSDDILNLVAEKAAKDRGDMREALAIVNSAAKWAAKSGKSEIEKRDVELGHERLQRDETIEHIKGQTAPKKILLLLILKYWDEKHEYPTVKDLKVRYNNLVRNRDRDDLEELKLDSVRAYLMELCTYEYVEKIGGSGRGRGKGREPHKFKLTIDEDKFREEFYDKYIK